MTNEELLDFKGSSELLTSIEQQERFILQQAAVARPCPNCGRLVNQFEAMGLTVNEYDTHASHADTEYSCPECNRQLRYILPLTGSWFWWLLPLGW